MPAITVDNILTLPRVELPGVGHEGTDVARVGDPVVVFGPKGAGPISPADFADWVARSGIRLRPR